MIQLDHAWGGATVPHAASAPSASSPPPVTPSVAPSDEPPPPAPASLVRSSPPPSASGSLPPASLHAARPKSAAKRPPKNRMRHREFARAGRPRQPSVDLEKSTHS